MQNYAEQINKALLAHGAWKQRLNLAINSGSSEFSPTLVQVDNQCDFGKWFYELPANVRSTETASEIKQLHAEFHIEATRILGLALEGKKNKALQALLPGEKYSLISGQLVLAMNKWAKLLSGG